MVMVVRLVAAALLLFFGIGCFLADFKTSKSVTNPVQNLSDQEKEKIKESFKLARNHYIAGRYVLCLRELAKLHETVPQFENSKELESFCEMGRTRSIDSKPKEQHERERAIIDQKIRERVETCEQTLETTATVKKVRSCLEEAIRLAPEHPLVIEMLHKADVEEKKLKL